MNIEKSKTIEIKETSEYYTSEHIDKLNAHYNVIFGKRSNGKTYNLLYKIIKNYAKNGEQGAYVRRYREDFRGKRGNVLFDGLVANDVISELTDGKWDCVKFYSDRWYLAKHEENDPSKMISDSTPFCYAFALAQMEHDKSTSYPLVTTIVFDEFISRIGYLPNEFVLFMNCLSTVIRQRNDVKVYMLGNTVNKYGCPYFEEMGLGHVEKMEPGTIDIYKYGESKLKVAVEYAANHNVEGRKSDVYFAFDNPSLEMITGGVWELDIYPHLTEDLEFDKKNVIFSFFIDYSDNILQCDTVEKDDNTYMYIHKKSTPIRHPDEDLILCTEYSAKPNMIRDVLHSTNKITKRILEYFKNDRVFYQDNDTGEIVNNYMMFCKKLA